MPFVDLARAALVVSVLAIPLALTVVGVVDAARRPQWAWALADRSQLAWMAALLFGGFSVVGGLGISLWYLLKVRPLVAAAEGGDFPLEGRGGSTRREARRDDPDGDAG